MEVVASLSQGRTAAAQCGFQVPTRAGGRVEVVASLSQGRTAAAQCGLFTHKSVPVIFEPACILLLLHSFTFLGSIFYQCIYGCIPV